MVDIVNRETRSRMMAAIRGKDTNPELRVRSYLHRAGLRFSLHRADLPGRPDLVLPKHGVVVFVNGCFWHQHRGCPLAYMPKSRVKFWTEKLSANVLRDRRNYARLRRLGWRVLVCWQCQIDEARLEALHRRIRNGRRRTDEHNRLRVDAAVPFKKLSKP